jgi:hypothetical protein
MQQLRPQTPTLRGRDVERWQTFLIGRGYALQATAVYDAATITATKKYQRGNTLIADGVVGNSTLNAATSEGFALFAVEEDSKNKYSQYWPPRPTNLAVLTDAQRKKMFGEFKYTAKPTKSNPEAIVIDPKWVEDNIVVVSAAEFEPNTHAYLGEICIHKLAADPLRALFAAWQKQGLLGYIVSWDGSFVPRFKRGRAAQQDLSNHSWGTAFDINANENPLGAIPALYGSDGCVREMVQAANKLGFYWGGHYSGRLDGMHFELVRPLMAHPLT